MLVIVPRDQAGSCASLAAEFEVMPGCRVLVDRRLGERRRGQAGWQADEWRRGDRRSSALEYSQGLVVLLR